MFEVKIVLKYGPSIVLAPPDARLVSCIQTKPYDIMIATLEVPKLCKDNDRKQYATNVNRSGELLEFREISIRTY